MCIDFMHLFRNSHILAYNSDFGLILWRGGMESLSQVSLPDKEGLDSQVSLPVIDGLQEISPCRESDSLSDGFTQGESLVCDDINTQASCNEPKENSSNKNICCIEVPNFKEIKESIDEGCYSLYEPWKSQIVMDMTLVTNEGLISEKCDIFKYSSPEYYEANVGVSDAVFPNSVYFDLLKYAVVDGYSGSNFQELSNDLCKACIQDSGFTLVKNGFKTVKSIYCQEFVCNRSFTYRGKIDSNRSSMKQYRGKSYNNDRKKNRSLIGQCLPRMTNTC